VTIDPEIEALKLRIRSLELTTGQAGPPGSQGPQGPMGPTGPAGIGVENMWSPYDSAAFGTYPNPITNLRIRPFYHYTTSTDQYGIAYIPTGFTTCFAMCIAGPPQDPENIHIATWNSRVSSMSTAGIWCYRVSGGSIVGAPNTAATLSGIMIGC